MKKSIKVIGSTMILCAVFAMGYLSHAATFTSHAASLDSTVPAAPQSAPVQVIDVNDIPEIIELIEQNNNLNNPAEEQGSSDFQENDQADAADADAADDNASADAEVDSEQANDTEADTETSAPNDSAAQENSSDSAEVEEKVEEKVDVKESVESKPAETTTSTGNTQPSSGALYTYDEIDPSLFTGASSSGVIEKEEKTPVGAVVRDFMHSSNITGAGSTFMFFATKVNGFTVYGSAKYYCVAMSGAELGSVYSVTTEYDTFSIFVVDTSTSGMGEFRFIADSDVSGESILCGQVLSMNRIK